MSLFEFLLHRDFIERGTDMAKNNSKFFVNNFFEYENYSCRCEKETEYIVPGESPRYKLKICRKQDEPLYFSYASQKGLNLSGIAGGIISENILGKLLAIPSGDIDSIIDFLKLYGFLFPIPDTEYETVDVATLLEIINRIKATVLLMSSIAGKRDYKRMLILTTYLLYSQPVTLELSTHTYTSYEHTFSSLLWQYNAFPDLNRNQEVFDTKKFSVTDTLYEEPYIVDIEFFNSIRSSSNTTLTGSNSQWFKHLVALYTGYPAEDKKLRTIIDFYFHYQYEVGIFKDVNIDHLSYYSNPNRDNFTDDMKAALLKIAKMVIGEEINANLKGIYPQFDIETLQPTWKLNSLIEALYFSIFYMKPGTELYKECENSNCKHEKFFLISATVTNKKYCCPACANAAAQRRIRQRKLEDK